MGNVFISLLSGLLVLELMACSAIFKDKKNTAERAKELEQKSYQLVNQSLDELLKAADEYDTFELEVKAQQQDILNEMNSIRFHQVD